MNNGRARYVWDYGLTQEQFDAMRKGTDENGLLLFVKLANALALPHVATLLDCLRRFWEKNPAYFADAK